MKHSEHKLTRHTPNTRIRNRKVKSNRICDTAFSFCDSCRKPPEKQAKRSRSRPTLTLLTHLANQKQDRTSPHRKTIKLSSRFPNDGLQTPAKPEEQTSRQHHFHINSRLPDAPVASKLRWNVAFPSKIVASKSKNDDSYEAVAIRITLLWHTHVSKRGYAP